jgi:hypothetical protein
MRQTQKKIRPAKGLSPSFAKATAGSMKMKKGTRNKNKKNIASEIGRKYMMFLDAIIADNNSVRFIVKIDIHHQRKLSNND